MSSNKNGKHDEQQKPEIALLEQCQVIFTNNLHNQK